MERIWKNIGMAASLLVLAAAVAAQAPTRRAMTPDERLVTRMVELGLASTETGEFVPAPRERVVAWIADETDDIAELTRRVQTKIAARDWVQNVVLPKYPVPSPTPTPALEPVPLPTGEPAR